MLDTGFGGGGSSGGGAAGWGAARASPGVPSPAPSADVQRMRMGASTGGERGSQQGAAPDPAAHSVGAQPASAARESLNLCRSARGLAPGHMLAGSQDRSFRCTRMAS